MAQRADRYIEAFKLVAQRTPFTTYCYDQLQQSQALALGHTVQRSSNILAVVTQNNYKSHTVNLHTKTCTCGQFQANFIPCSHACAFLENLQTMQGPHFSIPRPYQYIPKSFRVDIWHQTYHQNILPILISDIPASTQITAPTQQQNKRGHPKVKRFISGTRGTRAPVSMSSLNTRQGKHTCRRCGTCGHNRRTCKAQDQLELFAAPNSLDGDSDQESARDTSEEDMEEDNLEEDNIEEGNIQENNVEEEN
ncbi:hypothetical protein L211DRAFT_853900 [Terfezia boudieri ATCC MYA-4762]|uniref:SWIM-type domain-containing protein n=1 Tax=Terfezia boudieri ATCC MYA-4762 TaxID=1051890 RepID=A0A3N4LL83_9PEZI|nr:hypothetical protein L211DRAFT_853900 [Terfezia boudieri ATCC MYA-4762]